jgi:hypothetical protein
MVKIRISARWGEKNPETGELIEGAYADLEFDDSDMAGDQIQVWESLKVSWAAVRNQYMHVRHGPKWYMKELKKKAEKLGQVWRG